MVTTGVTRRASLLVSVVCALVFDEQSCAFKTMRSAMTRFFPLWALPQAPPDLNQAVFGGARTGKTRHVVPTGDSEHFKAFKKMWSLMTNFVSAQLLVK